MYLFACVTDGTTKTNCMAVHCTIYTYMQRKLLPWVEGPINEGLCKITDNMKRRRLL